MKVEAQHKVPAAARWLFPSIKDVLFLTFLFIPILMNESGVLNDGDTGWHIRNGEHILQTRGWPHSDYFSYTHYGQPWFSWEWLADVVLAIIHRYTGLNGVVVWANLTFGITFSLLFRWMIERGMNLFICLIFTALAGFASAVHWLARPHLFTLLFILIWYILLEDFQKAGMEDPRISVKKLWFLPVLILLWANLHAGFVVGLVLLIIFSFGNYLTSIVSRDQESMLKARNLSLQFAKIAVVCILVTLINPYGFSLYKHIFESYLDSQYLVDRITEFASPNFHTLVVRFFELILLSSLVVLGISYRRLSFIEIGLLVFWTHMALFSVRHVPLYTLIVVPLIVRHLTNYSFLVGADQKITPWLAQIAGRFNRYSANLYKFEGQFRGYLYPLLSVLIMASICLNQGYIFGSKVINANFDSKRFPIKAAAFIESQSFQGNLFTTDYWGGYIIYRFYPKYKVFFDGRSDMYGRQFIKEYERLTNLDFSWKGVLDKYKISWILLPVDYGLATALKELKEWQVVYDDHSAIIFVRHRD
jgi:hypothetical protein